MATAYINLGSNIGDRLSIIDRAVAAVKAALDPYARVSSVIESEPWGFDTPHTFLNVGMAFSTTLSPLSLLHALQQIEREISPVSHRNPDGSYRDRDIDIDIIAIDQIVIDTPSLTLPHPRMHLRTFVLIPMTELAPTWRHPLSHLTPDEMIASLND